MNKEDIIKICKQLYERKYITQISGNVSIRTDDNEIIITPSQLRKHELKIDQLCGINSNGTLLTQGKMCSSEYRVHLAVYNNRADVKTVIHSHPQFSIICSLKDISLDRPILPETTSLLGSIPTVPYAPPGSKELAEAIVPYLSDHNALILQRHGVLTFGNNLWEAFDRLEEVEYAASIAYHLFLAK